MNRTMRFIAAAIVGVAAALVVISLVGCSVAGSYVNKGVEKLSADNVEAQFDTVIRHWEGMTTAANNACQVTAGERSDDSPVLVESPAMAYAATYRNLRQKYNAAQADIFKAKLLGPPGYPKEVPDFPETNGASPDFCTVAAELDALRG